MGSGFEFGRKAVAAVGLDVEVLGEVDVVVLDLDLDHAPDLGQNRDQDQGLVEEVARIGVAIAQDPVHVQVQVHAHVHDLDLDPKIEMMTIMVTSLIRNPGQDPDQDQTLGLDQNLDREVKANKQCLLYG